MWVAASVLGSLLFQRQAIGKLSSRYHLRISDLLTANEQQNDDSEDSEGWQGSLH